MSTLKKCLKSAKIAIERNDPDEALEYIEEALEFDNNNYFAYIFQGKSYQLLQDKDKAKVSYDKAIKIEPDNLLGWKGIFSLLKSQNNFEAFFKVLAPFIEKQIDQGIGIGETIKDVRNYLDRNQYKSNTELYELFLSSIIPGSRLGDLVGNELGKPDENLKKLIDLTQKKENDYINKLISKEKMKLPRVLNYEQKAYLNNVSWSIHKESKLSEYYEVFLNICMDDKIRKFYEEAFLKYKYELFKVAPEKAFLYKDIKQMVEGMVLVKSDSLFCWNLYFDWSDVKDIGDFELSKITFFLKTFQNEGLGKVLYAYSLSEISPFEKSSIIKAMKLDSIKREKELSIEDQDFNADNEHEAELLMKVKEHEQGDSLDTLSSEEVLTLMLQGFAKCPNSVLAIRIVCNYYIHLREYLQGSEKCRNAIQLLADLQRNLGLDLKNAKEDLLCSLAIIYTHHESPKNFPRALQLYDKILETNESNVKAKIGKGLILIEQNELDTAMKLLKETVESYPNNIQARIEFHWCEIKMGNFESGRQGLEKALNDLKGTDLRTCETRAIIYWRIAKSFMKEDQGSSDNINSAYAHLIDALKNFKNHAPSYTLLGILYQDFYKDHIRAQKCFYKAFELDVGEILAAKYLVEDLTSKNEWDVAEILCKRLVNSERSKRFLLSKNNEDDDKAWPYRVLGCSALNKQLDAKAIEWFQSALRMTSVDLQCWIGLGEAYFNCGRLDASAKVFHHALSIDQNSWIINYMLGLSICEMGEFEQGFNFLNRALELSPKEECVLNALYESSIENANRLILGGFIGRSMDLNIQAVKLIARASKINNKSLKLWKALGESLKLFLIVQGEIESCPIEELSEIFKGFDFSNANFAINKDFEGSDLDLNLDSEHALSLFEAGDYVDSVSIFIILAAIAALQTLPAKVAKSLRSTTFYNLGIALLDGFYFTKNIKYRDSAINVLKKAIQLESSTSSFWVALGNSYVSTNPQISQHCFIKALSLDSNDTDTWTNLSALYLRYGDTDLAQEVFLRAQSVAPQKPLPWLGHAFVAQAKGEEDEAAHLFAHSYILSNGRTPLAQLLYGLSIVNKKIAKSGSDPKDIESAQEFSVANYAMKNYLKFYPNDETGLQIALLISERCRNFENSIEIGQRLCKVLEKKYESTENESVLVQYAKAKSQLSRIYLGMSDYANAMEAAEFSISILGEGADEVEEYESIILSSRIILGLKHFFNNDFDGALEQLQLILTTHSDSSKLVVLTAQVLHAYGTDDTKQAALDQLFAYIEEHGTSLAVVLTLGAISIVDNLEEYLPAIKDELTGLSLYEIVADSRRTVPKLLQEINQRIDSTDEEKIWQRHALLFPSDYSVWKELNIQMALRVASLTENKLTAFDYSDTLVATGNLREIQRSLVLYPGTNHAELALRGCF